MCNMFLSSQGDKGEAGVDVSAAHKSTMQYLCQKLRPSIFVPSQGKDGGQGEPGPPGLPGMQVLVTPEVKNNHQQSH